MLPVCRPFYLFTNCDELTQSRTQLLLTQVSDVNRIAAVIQAVVKEGDTIYGSYFFLVKSSELFFLIYRPLAASDSRKNGIAAGY